MIEGPPYQFNCWLSGNRFQNILSALRFTSALKPSYKDKFFEVRQFIDAWTTNIVDAFTPSWMSCSDKSMCPWKSRWSCPGWMVVPQKLHPFGNKYHTIMLWTVWYYVPHGASVRARQAS